MIPAVIPAVIPQYHALFSRLTKNKTTVETVVFAITTYNSENPYLSGVLEVDHELIESMESGGGGSRFEHYE